MPSLPPAICSTTRMVASLPVTICVAESAASLCSAAKVSARNAGTVHDSALPSTVVRKNWRRVWSVISFFITLNRSRPPVSSSISFEFDYENENDTRTNYFHVT